MYLIFNKHITELITCAGNPANVHNGMVMIGERMVGSTASIQCNENYRIQGDEIYTCSRSGVWEGSAQCGKYRMSILELSDVFN